MADSPDEVGEGDPIPRREFDDLAEARLPGSEEIQLGPSRPAGEQQSTGSGPDPAGAAATAPGFWSTRWLLVVAAVVAICVVSAVLFFTSPVFRGDPEPTQTAFEVPAEPVQGTVGESLAWYQHAGRGDVTVTDVRWETKGNQPPADGSRYLVLDLQITATAGQLSVNPLYLSAFDNDGNEVFLATMAGYQPEVTERSLVSGETMQAFATFEVPPEHSLIVFSDELFNPVLLIDVPAP